MEIRASNRLSRRTILVGGLASTICGVGPAKAQEPITMGAAAAFVGLALLQGAISYVGGQLMASALGGATITDVRTWIKEAVQEIETFIAQQLDGKIVQQIEADFNGIQDNLREYASLNSTNRSTNRFLVDYCDTNTALEIRLSLNYDQAVFLTIAGVGFRLFTLQSLYELDNDPGHITSARPLMDDFVAGVAASRDRISTALGSKIPVYYKQCQTKQRCTIKNGKRRCGGPVTYQCEILQPTSNFPALIRTIGEPIANKSSVDAQADNFIDSLTKPARDTQSDFVNKINTALNLATSCYDQMCKKVGGNYPIVPATSFSWAAVSDTISMPGATVKRP